MERPALPTLRQLAYLVELSGRLNFRVAAEVCDNARPDSAAALASCLEIAFVVRRATGKLPVWIAHASKSDIGGSSYLLFTAPNNVNGVVKTLINHIYEIFLQLVSNIQYMLDKIVQHINRG